MPSFRRHARRSLDVRLATALLSACTLTAACSTESALRALDPELVAEAEVALSSTERVSGELVVTLDDLGVADSLADDLSVDVIALNEPLGFARLEVHEADIADVLARLYQDPRVAAAEPDYLAFPSALPVDDPFARYQWNLVDIGVAEAWESSIGTGVTVAVLDTGVSGRGSDGFARLLQGADFIDGDRDPFDLDGHGTHVAGTVAQATNNGVGVAGVAPGASVLPVRVLGARGGSNTTIANGIVWATDNGADVINLSLGGPVRSTTLQRAVDYARARSVLLVAASGNEAAPVSWPAADPDVMAVGATGSDGRVAAYSNTGPELDLTAPGGDMGIDRNGDGVADGILQETVDFRGRYEFRAFEGTSMAAPHVAGALAILLGLGAEPDEARELLYDTAVDVGTPGLDRVYGHGRLALDRAVQRYLRRVESDEPDEQPPLPEPDVLGLADLAVGDLVVTEMMPNPSRCDDSVSEWIEVQNRTDRPVDLTDLLIADELGNVGRVSTQLRLAPGALAVLARGSASSFCDPGVSPDGFYGATPTLNNGGDSVRLAEPSSGRVLDTTPRWDSAPSGTSAQRASDGSWCWSTRSFDGRQLGSPGTANPACR